MRFFAIIIALFFSCLAFAGQKHTFMPENDLWMEDNLFANSAVDQKIFNDIVQAARDVYEPVAKANGERLVINALWTDATVNANACRGCKPGEATLNFYGGLARRAEVIPASFALVVGHELSHLYAGIPYIRPTTKMSAEGQSDYYSTLEVFEQLAKKVPALQEEIVPSDYVSKNCQENVIECVQALEGGLGLGALLANLMREPLPKYETPDMNVVSKTQLSYPATVQCRLDSYHNGWFHKSRPLCWYKP